MKAVQISKPGGNFEVVERPVPEPGRGQVRVKVEAWPARGRRLARRTLLPMRSLPPRRFHQL